MKGLLIGLLALGSFSCFANTCPDINGIFACTGTSSSDEGSIVKFETKSDSKGRTSLYINGGKLTDSYCSDSSFNQDLDLDEWGTATVSYVKTSQGKAEMRYDHHGLMKDGVSECVLLGKKELSIE